MPRKLPLPAPDRLFDRTWRPGRPFRPRVSLSRRWAMLIVFITLSGVIATYWYITDAKRVRAKAQSYLSNLIGGRVEIGKATLSIFEGFRLDNVRVYVDADSAIADIRADSELFSAETLKIDYSPRSLLTGNIEATRIVAIDPHVRLTEDPATRKWNYSRLQRKNRGGGGPSMKNPPPSLPEVALRNAQVDYSQVRPDGSFESQGSIKIEGLLSPVRDAGERYHFKVQSRGGKTEALGPEVNGVIDLGGKTVTASLHRFDFGRDIQAMLPAQVRTWWEEHGLAGRVEIPELTCALPMEGRPFRVKVSLDNVRLTVQPQEILSRDDLERRAWAAGAFDVMRQVGLNNRGLVDQLAAAVVPGPIAMNGVTGEFVFDQDGIDIKTSAMVEGNRINVVGHCDGYKLDAPASLRLSSSEPAMFSIPSNPRYMTSLPPNVREVYDHFKPQGTGSFWIQYNRPAAGARPEVTGELAIADGGFQFDKFPYPLRKARGKIGLERDAQTGEESVRIIGLKGHGITGGPNEKALVELDGVIGPFHPDLGVNVTVRGHKVASEPTLTASFPEQTRKALRLFDAEGKGDYPQFKGSFVTTIQRVPERRANWNIETNIHLDDARGAMVVFPYFMQGVTGDLTIRDDYLIIKNANMKRPDGATLAVNGRVDWGRELNEFAMAAQQSRPTLRPMLNFSARNVPVDRDLMEALPEDQRAWLRKLGIAGRFDLDGVVQTQPPSPDTVTASPAARPKNDVGFAFDIALHDCTLSPHLTDAPAATTAPEDVRPAFTNVNGKLQLTPQRVILSEITAKRGDGELTTHGSVTWAHMPPQVALVMDGRNLLLDPGLYQLLPGPAQKGWDQVQPQGTLDARVTYNGAPGGEESHFASDEKPGPGAATPAPAEQSAIASAVDVEPTTAPSTAAPAYEVVLIPRKLSATPKAAPYRLDDVTGSITVTPGHVLLRDIAGHHGDARVRVAGTGQVDASGGGDWRWSLRLSGDHMLVDDDLRRAAPSSVTSLLVSSQMQGTVAIDFSKLDLAPAARTPLPATDPSNTATTAPADSPTDVDFVLRLDVANSDMNVGVPLAHVNGSADLAGNTRGGKLIDLSGQVGAESLSLADRPITDFHADLSKITGTDVMQLKNMQAKLARGDLAGQIDWTNPDVGKGRYAMNLMVRNADVRELAGEDSALNGNPDTKRDDMRGQMSASLALEGVFDQPASRRGRGDVLVNGQQLYQIPLVLGLLQITNLALPITSPFSEATCRYSVDGGRVTFENIELRAKQMLMQGSGHLDFDTKKVRMTFITQNQTWPKLPLIGDLIEGARNELLQIHIRGTIQDPKVSAGAMNTLTTTIDEVFRGAAPPPEPATTKPKKK